MKISTKGKYGLKAMIDLAIYSKDSNVSIRSISERQCISENYLEQIIAVLKQNNLVRSSRGAKGGYSLKEEPNKITVGEILRALEGDLSPIDCVIVNEDKVCNTSEFCVTKHLWKKINDSINDVVNTMTLQELVEEQLLILDKSREEQ